MIDTADSRSSPVTSPSVHKPDAHIQLETTSLKSQLIPPDEVHSVTVGNAIVR